MEKHLDSQLWHACAGVMVKIPCVNSKVYYFPEGHAEHAGGDVDFSKCPRVPALIACRVGSVNYMADRESDEVFVKMTLVPIQANECGSNEDDGNMVENEKPASFAKTLTQSDANNGGGFSVPRYCAETIFPRLDYSVDPPVQTVLVKDVHGELWKFRHIYRGTPRRHLLTTGWSNFVNQKKLLAGDSVVFLKADNGDLCIGIRRAKRGVGDGVVFPSSWNQSGNYYISFPSSSVSSRGEESRMMKSTNDSSSGGMGTKGRVNGASVVEAITLAGGGWPFEVVYYPRAGTPEFCMGVSTVRTALRTQWGSGLRFKMAFETEDSSRISWFMGAVVGTRVADPKRWPNSPWRMLQVTWDEPDLLQNVKSVNPWLVELVHDDPALQIAPFPPPSKKMCFDPHPEYPSNKQTSTLMFPNPFLRNSIPTCYPPDYASAGIQGARHAQLDLSNTNLHRDRLKHSLFPSTTRNIDHRPLKMNITTGNSAANDGNISSFLTIGSPSHSENKSPTSKNYHFVLFGQPILVERQLPDKPFETDKSSDSSQGLGTPVHQSGPSDDNSEGTPQDRGHNVIIEPKNAVNLSLSVFDSPNKLHMRLADMFGIEKPGLMPRVLYGEPVDAQMKDELVG